LNLIVRLLLEIGIFKPAHGTWSEIKSRQTAKKKLTKTEKFEHRKEEFEHADYTRDPIQAPRRMPDDADTISIRSFIIIMSVVLIIVGLLAYAMNEWIFTGITPITPERELRAEWQSKTRIMTCMELKNIIEEDSDSLPSVAWQFSYWEYTGNERFYPSPRPDDECHLQAGYLDKDIKRCARYGTAFSLDDCTEYVFTRNKETMTITFPHDWSFIDRFSQKKFTDPNEYITSYYPELGSWHGIINGSE